MSTDTPINASKPLDFTPAPAKSQPAPKPEYALVEDVTGTPPPKRGAIILTDTKGNELKVPHAPNSKCKKCFGRGYIGHHANTKAPIFCIKCYPPKK